MRVRLPLLAKKAIVLALPLLALAIVWAMVVTPIVGLYGDLDEQLDKRKALLLRYRNLASQEELAKSDLKRLSETSGKDDLFYDSANPNAAAALLQQKIGEIIAAAGGQMRMARAEVKPKTANQQPFSVNLTFAASTAGLACVLFQIESLRPIVFVNGLAVRAGPALSRLQGGKAVSDKETLAAEDPVLDVTLTASALARPR